MAFCQLTSGTTSLVYNVCCTYMRTLPDPRSCFLLDPWPLSGGLDVKSNQKSKVLVVVPLLAYPFWKKKTITYEQNLSSNKVNKVFLFFMYRIGNRITLQNVVFFPFVSQTQTKIICRAFTECIVITSWFSFPSLGYITSFILCFSADQYLLCKSPWY